MKTLSFIFTIVFLSSMSIGSGTIIKVISLLLLIFWCAFDIFTTKGIIVKYSYFKYVYILVALIAIAALRNNHPLNTGIQDVFKIGMLIFFILAYVRVINESIRKKLSFETVFFWTIILPFLCSLLISFILYTLGFGLENVNELDLESSGIFSTLGISENIKSLPFVIGSRGYRTMIGLLLTLSLISYQFFRKYKIVLLFSIFVTTITLILIDNRAALIFPYLIGLFVYFSLRRTWKPRFLWFIPLITILGPNFLLLILTYASEIPALSFLARSSEDLSTGNSRSIIWLFSSLEFLNFKDIHLIGYGEFGHYESGASELWAFIFSQWENSDLITPHNVMYSILFDYGYFGLIFILFLQFKVISILRKNWKDYKNVCIVLLSFFIYWNFIGVTESFFGFYIPNLLFFYIAIHLLILTLDKTNKILLNNHANQTQRALGTAGI